MVCRPLNPCSFVYGLSWRDAPAEAAYLFHKRCQAFMANIIRGGKGAGQRAGPLGRVLHWVVRYEAQDRGSLHAHIILWVHPDDKARVASEIVACIPAVYRGNGSDPTCPTSAEYWEVPADPNAAALFAHVLTKQMHVCRPNGCCTAGACKYGFPTRPHTAAAPALDPATLRYQYYRPSWAHRNVSPYHPTVALLWGAHINLQVGPSVSTGHEGCCSWCPHLGVCVGGRWGFRRHRAFPACSSKLGAPRAAALWGPQPLRAALLQPQSLLHPQARCRCNL